MLALLTRAATLAEEQGWPLYLNGGYVRDLLLQIPNYDIDITVVGDAPTLAAALQRETTGRLETADRFATAHLELGGALPALDLVTARKEIYEHPGALPTVEPGTIYDDLARRDFTINAMAIPLAKEGAGPLLDPHRGLADLRARLVRVLHDRSFLDDPTRIFRAVRYAARLGFTIEPRTLDLTRQAIGQGAIATVSTDRLVREILLTMQEPNAPAMLGHLEELGALRAVHPSLTWPHATGSPGARLIAPLTSEERRDAYLAILASTYAGDPSKAEALARSLGLDAQQIRLMRDTARLAGLLAQLGTRDLSPSQVYRLLADLDEQALQASARSEAVQASAAWPRLSDYLDRLRHVKPELDGHYLRSLGVAPGPIYRRALAALHHAKLDGKLQRREDEESFVREWLEKEELSGEN
jgi:tRNA nucleotidyltransferase (CCA-adding enzyme)